MVLYSGEEHHIREWEIPLSAGSSAVYSRRALRVGFTKGISEYQKA